jgi:hypothetical protein
MYGVKLPKKKSTSGQREILGKMHEVRSLVFSNAELNPNLGFDSVQDKLEDAIAQYEKIIFQLDAEYWRERDRIESEALQAKKNFP